MRVLKTEGFKENIPDRWEIFKEVFVICRLHEKYEMGLETFTTMFLELIDFYRDFVTVGLIRCQEEEILENMEIEDIQ